VNPTPKERGAPPRRRKREACPYAIDEQTRSAIALSVVRYSPRGFIEAANGMPVPFWMTDGRAR
jgi:hypothetical protein